MVSSNMPVSYTHLAHLAAFEPERYIGMYADAGADYIAVHYEAMKDPLRVFEQIREAGARPVLAYKSTTPPGEDFITLAGEADVYKRQV